MSAVKFTRRPYTITYMKDGERQTIRRRPPRRAHNIWPEDLVSLKETKNIDWQEGEKVSVRHINPRHPNTLQLVNDDGETTFVEYHQVAHEEKIGLRDGVHPNEIDGYHPYLVWP